MLQVVPVDGQHAVVAAEPAVLSSQAPFQEVEDENARLVGPAHQLDAQLLAGVALVQGHLEAVLPPGARRVPVGVRAAAEAPLPQHRQVQHRARLRQHGSSVVVGHVADVKAIDLRHNSKEKSMSCFHMFSEVLSKVNSLAAKPPLEQPTCFDLTRAPLLSFHSFLQTHT